MLHLKTFGGLSVAADAASARGAAQHRKTLALLALLAAASRRGMSRDKLIAYLWPDADTEHGRNLLNQACYALRRDLHAPELFLGATELRLNPEIISSDLQNFEEAFDRGDPARAVAIYSGPFLDGFYLSEAGELERWVEEERARLATRAAEALESLAARATATGDVRASVKWWRRLTELDPFSAHAALGLMQALDAAGERVQALDHGRRFEAFVRQELGAELSAQVTALMQRLRHQTGETVQRTPESVAASPTDVSASGTPTVTAARAPLRSARLGSRPALGAAAIVFAGILVVAGYFARVAFTRHAVAPAGRIMLAVLPFENLTGDREQEYLSDGLTEEMITQLGRLHPEDLGVIARTSAMQYKNTQKRTDQIGSELGVAYLLEGGLRRAGDRMLVSARLIRVRDQTQVWAESYERDLRDILALQSEVAHAIAREIDVKLTPQEEARAAGARLIDPRAHEFYLKGRYFWNKRSEEGYTRAIHYFEQAIAREPGYARAYAGLADAYALLGSIPNAELPRSEAMPRARVAALRALELDEGLAEAHTSLAFVRMHFEWDWPNAKSEFARALELNPGYATAHHWYAFWLIAQGRAEEALREIRLAQELDPLSLIINTDVGEMLYYARRYDAAIEQAGRTVEMDPGFALARRLLGVAYRAKGQFTPAIHELEAAARVSSGRVDVLASLGHAYAEAGRTQEARKVLDELEQASQHRPDMAYWIATILAGVGEKNEAFAWLEKSYQEHNGALILLQVAPELDPLRSDARFQDLMRRVALLP